MALTDKLSAIGAAIRQKTGKSDLLTLDQMPTEIASIQTGGGVPDEALHLTGDSRYRFANGAWDWFIDMYDSQITTSDITHCGSMFSNSFVKNIPFEINGKNISNLSYMFYNSYSSFLTSLPKIRGIAAATLTFNALQMFYGLSRVRDIEELFSADELAPLKTVKITSRYSCPRVPTLASMRSIRTVPSWFNQLRFSEESTVYPATSYSIYISCFMGCYSLNEIVNLLVLRCASEQKDNMFDRTFSNCYRLKNITFETQEDGSPFAVQWKNQEIDLSTNIGWATTYNDIVNTADLNNGITADKEVKDDATYQALKNDPDWFTTYAEYSRYNHDSAVATINSLPDTSAYLATAGGTNTIKFKGSSGSLTDGGAISNLTAEEIAVATAKGWTVSLV